MKAGDSLDEKEEWKNVERNKGKQRKQNKRRRIRKRKTGEEG